MVRSILYMIVGINGHNRRDDQDRSGKLSQNVKYFLKRKSRV